MSEVVEISVYGFEELIDDAKVKAREWYREGGFDYNWWEGVYDQFEEVCALLGVDLSTRAARLMGGGTRQAPNIYFRGFWSQGDGACFEGRYQYKAGAAKALRNCMPKDTGLHGIACKLQMVQRRNFYQLTARAVHRGHYYHAYCMRIEVERDSPTGQDMGPDDESTVVDALRALADWLYSRLEEEYDYLTSDAVVSEVIAANGYRFYADGSHFS